MIKIGNFELKFVKKRKGGALETLVTKGKSGVRGVLKYYS